MLLLCYVTDRAQFSGDEVERRAELIKRIGAAARAGVDFIQLREKDLSARELEALTLSAVQAVRENSLTTQLLINSRTDVAIACGADGVHLTTNDISPREVRRVWRGSATSRDAEPVISAACHSEAEVARAQAEGADFALFAPVFGKKDAPSVAPAGLDGLRGACRKRLPVLALGGVDLARAGRCLQAGAAGIAAIRLFQEGDVGETMQSLRRLGGPQHVSLT